MDDSTDAVVSAADAAIANARAAIAAAANVPPNETRANTTTVDVLASRLSTAKTNRQAVIDADRTAKAAAIAALAKKLYGGRPAFDSNTVTDGIKARNPASGKAPRAFYSGTNPTDSLLTVNFPADIDTYNLTEDKKTTVAPHLGWAGKRFTLDVPGSEFGLPKGTLEAVVYSNVEPIKKKFGKVGSTPTPGYQFRLRTSNDKDMGAVGHIDIVGRNTYLTQHFPYIASPMFDFDVGYKRFELPDNAVRVEFPGTLYGVSGTYSCSLPSDTPNLVCAVAKTAEGFRLGEVNKTTNTFLIPSDLGDLNSEWRFKPDPGNSEQEITVPDINYVSYGWWLFKSADDKTYAAFAFSDEHRNVPGASGITTLQGTATYTGGAAGLYALSSTIGGTNDAGRFTARATLEADFNTDMVTGTIDRFTGADGESRNWSVELKKSGVGDTGMIRGANGTGNTLMKTVWTIGDEAAVESGQWQGRLLDNGDDLVPKVGMGTFYTEYSNSGKMVGGFGVNCTTCATEDN